MPFIKDPSRQAPTVAEATILFSDLTSGVALPAIDIPAGAIIKEVNVYVDTAFNSATSDSLVVGDGGATNRFVASVSIAATGGKAMVATAKGYKYAVNDTIDVIWTGVGAAPSTGKFRLMVEYFQDGRADFAQR